MRIESCSALELISFLSWLFARKSILRRRSYWINNRYLLLHDALDEEVDEREEGAAHQRRVADRVEGGQLAAREVDAE
jgi:uncharacterized protein YpiB (UPF0302 family)